MPYFQLNACPCTEKVGNNRNESKREKDRFCIYGFKQVQKHMEHIADVMMGSYASITGSSQISGANIKSFLQTYFQHFLDGKNPEDYLNSNNPFDPPVYQYIKTGQVVWLLLFSSDHLTNSKISSILLDISPREI
jgi:hypothetical protein